MKAFITGITGFAASHLVAHLLAEGDAVMGSALAGTFDPAHTAKRMGHVELLPWDLRNEPSTALSSAANAFAPDCIYHLAAISNPAQCGEHEPTELARQVNVDGTARVLALAQRLPGPPRVLVVSSSYVYGRADTAAIRVNELSDLVPHRGYGKTKAAAEKLALDATAAGKLDCLIARPFNHSGPRQTPEMMLPEWAQQFAASATEPVAVHTLDAWLDLCDVRDVVRAYRLLMQHGEAGGIYNIGGGVMRRSGDCFARLHQLAGGNRPYLETRPGERFSTIADCTRLHKATGWRPQIPLWQTIADSWAYWQHRYARA